MVGLDFGFWTIENGGKRKKLLDEGYGKSDRRGESLSSFRLKKIRISDLITCKSSESRNVDLTNNGMSNHYLREFDHGSHYLECHRTASFTYMSD